MPVSYSTFFVESRAAFFLFFFFLSHLTCVSGATSTVAALFITVHVLKNIKNRSHETIHTFKNYFAIILSIFSFSNNKFNPNGPIEKDLKVYLFLLQSDLSFLF